MNLSIGDIILILTFLLAAIAAGFYFYNRKNYKKVVEAKNFIENNKMVTSIFVIDKKYVKPSDKNLPKIIYDKLPKTARLRKMAIIKAKVGPQIATLTCDKNVYDALTPKKTVKIELSGIYIVNIVGLNLADKKNKTIRERIALYMNRQ